MAGNNNLVPPEIGHDMDYDGDAAYNAYLNSVAPPVPPDQIQEFCPAEIPVRTSLLRGDSALMRTFPSRGFLLSPISITAAPIQIVQLIRAVSTFLPLEPAWLNLPGNWLSPDQMLFVQPNHFTIYVTLRLEVIAGSDGDGIHDYETEPADVESPSHVIYPACITLAGLISSSSTPVSSQTLFLQFMPLHWNSSRRMEIVLFRNFPFDSRGSHTRLLLHLLAEYIDSCLRKNGQADLAYYMVLTPTQIGKTKITEGIVRVFLPPILPGLNMDLPSLFRTAVGLSSSQPVILSFGWTQLLMAGNLGDLLCVDYLPQYGMLIPQEMFITGVAPGTPLAASLVSLWADVNWSQSCFDQIAAAYFDRSAPYNLRPNMVTPEIAASHGGADTLHLIVASRDNAGTASRFFVGQSMGELMGVGPIGQPLTPLPTGLSPCDMALYVKHVKAYTAQLTPTSAVPSSGRGRAGRAPLRSSRTSPRTGRAAPLRAPVPPKLTVIDAESRARAQLAMWAAPLMSDVIPPGGLTLHRPFCRLSWPSLQSSWALISVRILWRQMRPTWTRDPDSEQSPPLCSAPFPLVHQLGNINLRSCFHSGLSPSVTPTASDYEQYYASTVSIRGLGPPPLRSLPPDPSWLPLYDAYLNKVPSHGLLPRPSLVAPTALDECEYQIYHARVLATSSIPLALSFTCRHPLHRRGRVGSLPSRVPLWDEEYFTYHHRVSIQALRPSPLSSHRLRPSHLLPPPSAWNARSCALPFFLFASSSLRGCASSSLCSRGARHSSEGPPLTSVQCFNVPSCGALLSVPAPTPQEELRRPLLLPAVSLSVSDAAVPDLDGSCPPLPIATRRSLAAAPSQADLSLGGSGPIQVCITGQDPISCLGEGDGKGDPPCRFVPQGGPDCRAPPCRYPSLGSQGGPGTREDPPLRSPWEGGGTGQPGGRAGSNCPRPPYQTGQPEGRAGTNCTGPPYQTGQPDGRAGLIRISFHL